MSVYRDYDQAGLDAQYNLRARLPGFILHFQRWAKASEAVRRTAPAKLDLRYGRTAAETLDFFPAAVRGADEEDLVNSGLEETMISALGQMRAIQQRDRRIPQLDLRTAAFVSALDKIAQSYLELGIFP